MNFNGNSIKIYKKLKIKNKDEIKNSYKSIITTDQSQDKESLVKNLKMVISSRSSFFDEENNKAYFKKDNTPTQRKKNMKDSETNTEPIDQLMENTNQNTDTNIIHNRINLRKSYNSLSYKNYFKDVDYNKDDEIIKLMISDQKTDKHFNINSMRVISTPNKINQQTQKNKYTDLLSFFSPFNDKTRNYKNNFYMNKIDFSKDFNEKFLVESYNNNRVSKKKAKNINKNNKLNSNPFPILITNSINKFNNKKELTYKLHTNHIFDKNFISKSTKKEKIKNEYNKIFDLKFLGCDNKENKNKDKRPLKLRSLNKTNIEFNPGFMKNANKLTIVENNNSLKQILKLQTVSNFNNKYNLKYKTNNPKVKEKIEELFDFMKLHKNEENSKNSDFLCSKKKRIQNNNNKFVEDNYSDQFNAIIKTNEINNIYQKEKIYKKQKKMISIKTLGFFEKE